MRSVTFTKGELSPRLFGRYDLEAYYQGLARCLNFLPIPQGAILRRPGLQWVCDAPVAAQALESRDPRLFPFIFDEDDAFVLIFTPLRLYFLKNGALIQSGGGDYNIVTPYAADELSDIRVESQVGDVATVTHPLYPPRELTRIADDNWTLAAISNASTITPVSVTNLTRTGPAPTSLSNPTFISPSYVVTSVVDGEESEAGTPYSTPYSGGDTGVDFAKGQKVRVEWSGSSPPDLWNVYKSLSASPSATNPESIMGYIGSCDEDCIKSGTAQFGDDYITADFSQSPPVYATPFNATDKYPRHSAFFQDRRWFANTNDIPYGYWATGTGLYSLFPERDFSVPSDAIIEELRSARVSDIRWMIPLGQSNLVIGTGSGVFVLSPREGTGLAPGANRINQETYRGAANLFPILIESSILYVEQNFRSVRDMAYDFDSDGYRGNDLVIFSEHLLQDSDIRSWDWSKSPYSVVYIAMEDGTFRTLTYDRGHRVVAWAQHKTPSHTRYNAGDTDRPVDKVRDFVVIPEGGEDRVYALCRRQNGAETDLLRETKLTIERVHTTLNTDRRIDVYSDCAGVFDGRGDTDDDSGLTTLKLSATGSVGDQRTLTSTPLGTVSFTSDMVGNRWRLKYPVGRQAPPLSGPDTRVDELYEVQVLSITGTNECEVRLLDDLPIERDFGTSLFEFPEWEYAKKRFEAGPLDSLINREVTVLADGYAVGEFIVQRDTSTSPDTGYIELNEHASTVVAGLLYNAEAHTMPLLGGQSKTPEFGSAIVRAHVDVQESRGLEVGVVGEDPQELRQPDLVWGGVYADPPPYYTGLLGTIVPADGFDPAPQLSVVSRYPVRSSIIGIHIEYERSR